MNITLTYEELSAYVMRHYGKRISLAKSGEQALQATYHAGLLSQSVTLRIAEIENNKIFIAFTGGALVNLALKWLPERINKMLGSGIRIFKGHYLTVDLKEIPQAEALAAALDIRSIDFAPSDIRIQAALK